MLWDLIRDFFVEHIFGGTTSGADVFYGVIGPANFYSNGEYVTTELMDTSYFPVLVGFDGENNLYLNLGDWLSTTATIISISIIVVLCCLFVYKIIKLIGGLIR